MNFIVLGLMFQSDIAGKFKKVEWYIIPIFATLELRVFFMAIENGYYVSTTEYLFSLFGMYFFLSVSFTVCRIRLLDFKLLNEKLSF